MLEEVLGEPLEGVENVLNLYECHFAVYLSEFGLAISAKVFIAEAFYDLEVAIHASYHEYLLEGLWRLGQCIELAWVEAGWHYEVPGTFWCTFDEERGFYLYEVLAGQVFAYFEGQLRAEDDVVLDRGAAQV